MDPSGGRVSTLPEGAQLQVSIKTSAGVPVLINQRINLLTFGGGYISEPFELKSGYYTITEFFIVNGSEILYATPLKGSRLANAVIHPLEFTFYVAKGKIRNVPMEVIDVNHRLPEDFGYASFPIGIVNTFEIALFKIDDGEFNLTSGDAYILSGTDTLRNFQLGSKINRISFAGDSETMYTLVVIKDGYARYTKEFIAGDLIEELDNKALKIYLEPALTMLAYSSEGSFNLFQISVEGELSLEIEVDWGDGLIEHFTTSVNGVQSHTYSQEGNHFVTVTGNLSEIIFFYSFYGQGMMDKVSFEHLTNLEDIRLGITRGPKTIDLSNNTQLRSIQMTNIYQLEELILPEHHFISSMGISGPNELDTEDIDYIIANIYANAVSNNIQNGHFSFVEDWAYYENGLMVGPPSPISLQRLRILQGEDYYWDIVPENF